MFKIFIFVLATIALYQNINMAPCEKSISEECASSQRAVSSPPQAFGEPGIVNEISFSPIDGSRPYNPQIMHPVTISYTRIKGGSIDIEQLTSR